MEANSIGKEARTMRIIYYFLWRQDKLFRAKLTAAVLPAILLLATSSLCATFDATGTWKWTMSGWYNTCPDPENSPGSGIAEVQQTGDSFSLSIPGDTGSMTGVVVGANYQASRSESEGGETVNEVIFFSLSSSTAGTGTLLGTWSNGQQSCSWGGNLSLSKDEASAGFYSVGGNLWIKAVLKPTWTNHVTLKWIRGGEDTSAAGDTTIWGYMYADPNDFPYGSQGNPEAFVKIYLAKNGWKNIAFNHVTVDDVDIFSALNYDGTPDQQGTITLKERVAAHEYKP